MEPERVWGAFPSWCNVDPAESQGLQAVTASSSTLNGRRSRTTSPRSVSTSPLASKPVPAEPYAAAALTA